MASLLLHCFAQSIPKSLTELLLLLRDLGFEAMHCCHFPITRASIDPQKLGIHLRKQWYYDTAKTGDPGSPNALEIGTYCDLEFRKAWNQ